MKLVDTVVKENQVSYTWEREFNETVERCTVTIDRHSQDLGIPARDDPRWKKVE